MVLGGVCIVPRLEQDCCSEAITGGGVYCSEVGTGLLCRGYKKGGGVYGTKVGIRLLYRGYNRGGGGVLFDSEVREPLTAV